MKKIPQNKGTEFSAYRLVYPSKSVHVFCKKTDIEKGLFFNIFGGIIVAYPNAYAAYRETGVKTASQGKLIIMLYEEACRQLKNAEELFQDGDKIPPKNVEKLNKCIVRSQEIITELMVSLDMERGGEIAKNLMALYAWFNQQLLEANINRKREKIASVHKMMSDLCGAWNTAVETTAPVASTGSHSSIDING